MGGAVRGVYPALKQLRVIISCGGCESRGKGLFEMSYHLAWPALLGHTRLNLNENNGLANRTYGLGVAMLK